MTTIDGPVPADRAADDGTTAEPRSDDLVSDDLLDDDLLDDDLLGDDLLGDDLTVDEVVLAGGVAPGGGRAPWASVTACPNGPLLVRGDVEILLASGRPAARRRSTVALCRCGASGIKPFCDGSHKAVGFRTEDEPL